MGQSITYSTLEPVTAPVRKAIEAEAKRLNLERDWWCENIIFFKHRDKPKHLVGDTKLFIVGIEDDFDNEEEEQSEDAFDDDLFMAFYDARFILLTLAKWSQEFGVSWEVSMAGETVGSVVGGKIKPQGLFESDVSAKQLKADDKKAKAILAKYPDR